MVTEREGPARLRYDALVGCHGHLGPVKRTDLQRRDADGKEVYDAKGRAVLVPELRQAPEPAGPAPGHLRQPQIGAVPVAARDNSQSRAAASGETA